jgi:hypothetical protein
MAPIVFVSLLCLAAPFGSASGATVLRATEHQITSGSEHYNTTPILGSDATGPFVVWARRVVTPNVGLGPGSIYYQRLTSDGAPASDPVLVSTGGTDDELPDVSGSRIVYTTYDPQTANGVGIVVYDLATGTSLVVANGSLLRGARIFANWVAWVDGAALHCTLQLLDLDTLGTPIQLGDPSQTVGTVAIADRFVVWDSRPSGGYRDVHAYDYTKGLYLDVATDPEVDERAATTSGPWIVWESQAVDLAGADRVLAFNAATGERRVVADTGAFSLLPSIDGDLIAWEGNASGNYDVWVNRLSTGESFQVTTDPSDQRLNNVLGDLVAYIDKRTGFYEVYVSKLDFVAPDPCALRGGDTDQDGICNDVDNCPTVYNPDQLDLNGNGIGDACEAATPSCTLVSGIVGCYTFDGDFIDRSGNGNYGIPHGSPTFATNKVGALNGAVHFDGIDDYVALANEHAFDLTAMTIVATVRVPDYSRENWIANKGTLFGNFTLRIRAGTETYFPGRAEFVHEVASGNWDASASLAPVPTNQYFQVAVAFDSTGSRTFLNGIPQCQGTHPYVPVLNDSPVLVGAGGYYGLSDFFNGDIDELRIYNRALTDAEVRTLYAATFNEPPVASATASPQAVITVGTLVTLDATASYDPDGDPLTYAWTLTVPAGSHATLSSATAAKPTFVADVHGDYTAQVAVSDGWTQSAPASVVVSFGNVKPVANAGLNQIVNLGATVQFQGSGVDANLDPLTFLWTIDSMPSGSGATLVAPTSGTPSFVADRAGAFTVNLVVNDGIVNSDPSYVTVMVLSYEDSIQSEIKNAVDTVNGMAPMQFKNPTLQNTLTSKLAAVVQLVAAGSYADALDKLEHDILQKTNGCPETGKPDKNDWVIDCNAQAPVYAAVQAAIAAIQQQ